MVYGGRPERLLGFSQIACVFLGYVSRGVIVLPSPLRVLAVDGLLLSASLVLVALFRRKWLQPYAAFSVLTVASELAFLMDPQLNYYSMMTVGNIWGVLQTFVLAWGSWCEGERGVLRGLRGRPKHESAAWKVLVAALSVWTVVLAASLLAGAAPRVIAMTLLGSTLGIFVVVWFRESSTAVVRRVIPS